MSICSCACFHHVYSFRGVITDSLMAAVYTYMSVADPGFWKGRFSRRRHRPRSGGCRGVWGPPPQNFFDILDALRWVLEAFAVLVSKVYRMPASEIARDDR